MLILNVPLPVASSRKIISMVAFAETLSNDGIMTSGITFTTSHVDVESIPDIIKEQCVNQDYKIYLVNPRLYCYYLLGTVSLVHLEIWIKNILKVKQTIVLAASMIT